MAAVSGTDSDLTAELQRLQSGISPATLANPFGSVTAAGVIRSAPEDFRVTELPLEPPAAGGEHCWLLIRKTGQNTAWVAKQLAAYADVEPKHVSYAGLKDRHAVTRQWFSVWLPGRDDPDWAGLSLPGVEVLDVSRRVKKLRRGELRGNRFELRVRELEGNPEELMARLAAVAESGVPNYFGEQRFGRSGDNLRLLSGGRRLDRDKRSIAYSALRSSLFNLYLNQRVKSLSWNYCDNDSDTDRGAGDVPLSDRDGDLDVYKSLCGAAAEGRPTGALWGSGRGRLAATEAAFFASYPAVTQLLEQEGLRRHRRSMWLPVCELEWELADEPAGPVLNLSFSLPPGAFATTVLDMLLRFRLGNSA
ncbi:MAG: tRNA pseudouridine(13) synthase TruD [Gammaproteobacteria bacterium]|jgi:tRNA pseudouridine13 synthase|nr:tRNA pseudouridine(13) synthase TruD [Gammaproteobacteria bacterium]